MVLLSITSISFQQFSLKTLLRDGIPHFTALRHTKKLSYQKLSFINIWVINSSYLYLPLCLMFLQQRMNDHEIYYHIQPLSLWARQYARHYGKKKTSAVASLRSRNLQSSEETRYSHRKRNE